MPEYATSIGTLVLAIVSLVALVIAVVQVNENRRLARIDATLRVLSEAKSLEASFRYFDQDSDQELNRERCLAFFLERVSGRNDRVSKHFLSHVYALVDFAERVCVLSHHGVIDSALLLKSQCYNILSSYFALEPVLLRLAGDELLVFENYRELAIASRDYYVIPPQHNSVLASATFEVIPKYVEKKGR